MKVVHHVPFEMTAAAMKYEMITIDLIHIDSHRYIEVLISLGKHGKASIWLVQLRESAGADSVSESVSVSHGRNDHKDHYANLGNESSKFYCDSHTGGSCRFWSCSSTRGPTMCRSSQCRCKPGFCAVAGVCTERTAHVADTCNRDTGGSCRFFGCSSYRGATSCIDGACVCQVGYCSADDGSCHKPKARVRANVVPINSEQRTFPPSQAMSGNHMLRKHS